MGPDSCECFAGWQGEDCQETCPSGRFGNGCRHKCLCVNASRCDRRDGNCACRSGWTGSKCEVPCPAGLFGTNCHHHCACHNEAVCDPVNGRCLCPPGFTGKTTSQPINLFNEANVLFWTGSQCHVPCPAGSHGPDCSRVCSCFNSGKCHHVDGKCDCASGFFGEKCENECPENMHGKGCTQKCDCVHAKSCDKKTGICRCETGWTGQHCIDPCPSGYYGDYCNNKCECEHNFLQHCHIELGCVCRFGHKHNDSTVTVSGVPLSDCAVHSDLRDGPAIQNIHLIQERVSAASQNTETMPLLQQQVIFVLIFVLPLLVLCLVLFCRQINESDDMQLSYDNANYDADSLPAATMQPSQLAVQDQLASYANVLQSSQPLQLDTGYETDSRLSFLSTETGNIYDVPHSNLLKDVRPYAHVPIAKRDEGQMSTSRL